MHLGFHYGITESFPPGTLRAFSEVPHSPILRGMSASTVNAQLKNSTKNIKRYSKNSPEKRVFLPNPVKSIFVKNAQ